MPRIALLQVSRMSERFRQPKTRQWRVEGWRCLIPWNAWNQGLLLVFNLCDLLFLFPFSHSSGYGVVDLRTLAINWTLQKFGLVMLANRSGFRRLQTRRQGLAKLLTVGSSNRKRFWSWFVAWGRLLSSSEWLHEARGCDWPGRLEEPDEPV